MKAAVAIVLPMCSTLSDSTCGGKVGIFEGGGIERL